MAITYGARPLLKDSFEFFDASKWEIHGAGVETVAVNSGVITISNTTGTRSNYLGIHSLASFSVGTMITVRARHVQGRHSNLIGFGAAPYFPFPHASGSNFGFTWYSRADNLTSTVSWRSENDISGIFDAATENLTSHQTLKMIRVSSSVVELYRNDVLEYTATGLVLSNDYPVYFSNDGHTKPNTVEIDLVTVV